MVIAAITSCTNTSNPGVMLAAGLLAKKAVERGLKVPPHVKTSLAPGSRVVTDYLREAGLERPLEQLGFHNVGYGCMTCIGNSGPLPPAVAKAVTEGNLVAAAVLSGNRNFEGRVHSQVKANYLASPPLVVAYALAGTVDIDLSTEPLGTGSDGRPVYLKDVWPSPAEIDAAVVAGRPARDVPQPLRQRVRGERNVERAGGARQRSVSLGPRQHVHPGAAVPGGAGARAGADPADPRRPGVGGVGRFGDDRPHFARRPDCRQQSGGQVSPAVGRRAGRFQQLRGAAGKRPGAGAGHVRQHPHPQHAGPRHRRAASPATCPTAKLMPIYDAAMKYKAEGVPLLVLAGAEYGAGSSRDWAAKGPYLLGVRAVIASSFERIHRSNLVGMGILPLQLARRPVVGIAGPEGRGAVRHPRSERRATSPAAN